MDGRRVERDADAAGLRVDGEGRLEQVVQALRDVDVESRVHELEHHLGGDVAGGGLLRKRSD